MEYVVINSGKIKSHLCSQGKPTMNLLPGETLQEVNGDVFNGVVGEDIRIFDTLKGWQRKRNSQLYKEGLLEVPKGKKLEGENIVGKSLLEQYKEGELSRDELYYGLGIDSKRQVEIQRIVDTLDRHRNEGEAVKLGLRTKTTITEEEYKRQLALLEEWKAFKETCDVENVVYPE